MRKITLLLLGALAFVSTFFGNPIPELSAAPNGPGSPKENWKKLFSDGLFRADGTEVKLADVLRKKKFIGIYASASWCAPCRQYTPRLIEFYKEFGDRMEVVLVGYDDTQDKVFKYMTDHKMPWLTVKKDSPAILNYRARNDIRGIPNFRLYDAKTGKLLLPNEINLRAIRRIITGEKDTFKAGTPEDWKLFFKKGLCQTNGKKAEVDALKKKRFIALYCVNTDDPKSKKFTAELAAFYKKNKKQMEVVFYTYGKDKEQILKYMKGMKMPWLAMEPNPEEVQRFLLKYAINSSPDLRVFNVAGKPIEEGNLDMKKLNKLIK